MNANDTDSAAPAAGRHVDASAPRADTGPDSADPRADRGTPIEVVLSEEQLRVQTVRVPVEVVRLRTRIVTETVHVPVEVRRQELLVTRERLDPAAPDGAAAPGTETTAPAGDRDLVLTLYRETPVVTVSTVPSERVTVHVTTVTGQQTVSGDLRRENVDLTNTPGPDPQDAGPAGRGPGTARPRPGTAGLGPDTH